MVEATIDTGGPDRCAGNDVKALDADDGNC